MKELILALLALFSDDKSTTDDTWDCYVEEGSDNETCERELVPCHYEVDESECRIVVIRIRAKLEEL